MYIHIALRDAGILGIEKEGMFEGKSPLTFPSRQTPENKHTQSGPSYVCQFSVIAQFVKSYVIKLTVSVKEEHKYCMYMCCHGNRLIHAPTPFVTHIVQCT